MSAGRLENIPDDANFVCCDVKSPLARDVVKNGHFDAIVHLAAQTMVPASMEDPKKDMEDNIEGTVNILEAARKYGVKRIIFSSSAAVYGDIAPECLPVRETEPLRPVSFYGLSKMTCENYIRLYQKAYGLSYVIFRFANVYGERQGNGGEGGVVSVFARQLAEGKSPTIYGNGQQTRGFHLRWRYCQRHTESAVFGNGEYHLQSVHRTRSDSQGCGGPAAPAVRLVKADLLCGGKRRRYLPIGIVQPDGGKISWLGTGNGLAERIGTNLFLF